MKWVIVLVALAGCVQAPRVQTDAEAAAERAANAAQDQRNAERDAGLSPEQRNQAAWARVEADDRNRHAATICVARGRMAAATGYSGGPWLPGVGSAMLAQEISGNAVASTCWDTYRSTGIMPTY